MKLLGDKILIKVLEEETQTTGGIVLVTTDTGYCNAEVIAVGDTKELKDSGIKERDRVATSKQLIKEIEIDRVKYDMLKLENVIAILDNV